MNDVESQNATHGSKSLDMGVGRYTLQASYYDDPSLRLFEWWVSKVAYCLGDQYDYGHWWIQRWAAREDVRDSWA